MPDAAQRSVHLISVGAAREMEDWPGKGERERCWLSPSQATLAISEGGLVAMLLRLGLPAT